MAEASSPLSPRPTSPESINAAPNVVPLDPNRDAFSQAREHAKKIGQNDLTGLVFDMDGVRYVVDSDIVHHTTEARKVMRRLPSFSRQHGGAHTFEYRPEETEYITVEGYDSRGELVSRVQYPGAQFVREDGKRREKVSVSASPFADYLNGLVRKSIDNDGVPLKLRFGASEEPVPQTKLRSIPVKLHDDEPVFDTVMQAERDNLLPRGLVGLTWAHSGNTSRIIKDTVWSWKTEQGQRTMRNFVVEVTDAENQVVTRHKLDVNKLRDHLQVINPPDTDRTVFRFDLYDTGEPVPQAPPGAADEIERIKQSMKDPKTIKGLQEVINITGVDHVYNIASNMRLHFLAAMKKLGIEPGPDNEGLDWILARIAQHKPGSGNPVGDDTEARRIRQDIIDRKLGEVFRVVALKSRHVPVERFEEVSEADKQKGEQNDFRKVIKQEIVVEIRNEVTNLLQPFIREKVIDILQHAEVNTRKSTSYILTASDEAQIGRLLSQSVDEHITL